MPPMTKWHPMTPAIARELTQRTTTPGTVFQVDADAIPEQLRNIPGAVSFFVSSYEQGVPLPSAVTASAELAVVRHDGDTAKAYNWVLACSSDGGSYFAGMHKRFEAHHFATSKAVPVESLFGNPLTNKKP
jgi:hypothetical protein